MTLIEAVKSGRPFRRPGMQGQVNFREESHWTLTKEDILADDYEIQEEKKFVWAVKGKITGIWFIHKVAETEKQMLKCKLEIGKTAIKLEEV